MSQTTPASRPGSLALLAFAIAAALATPVRAHDANSAPPVPATIGAAPATTASPQDARNLGAVQVTATTTAVVVPTQASTIATEPQSLIGSLYLKENIPPGGDYTDAIAISPSVSTVAPNGPGLMEAAQVNLRGFNDGEYNVTFDGIPWGDSNDFTHHSTSYYTNRDTGGIVVDRGPGTAATLGNATFGGTVAVSSKDPTADFGIEPWLSFGSWNTRTEGAELDTGRIEQTGGTTALLIAQNGDSDGYLSYAGQRRQNVMAKIEQPLTDHLTLSFMGMYNKVHQYVPFGATLAQIQQFGPNYGLDNDPTSQAYYRYNRDEINTDMGYVGLHYANAGWTVDDKVYTYGYNHFGFNGVDPNGETPNGTVYGANDVPGQRMRNTYRSWGNIFRLARELGPGELHTGFWYDHQDNLRWQVETDETLGGALNAIPATAAVDRRMNDTLRTFQPYLEYQWNFADTAWLTAGVKDASFKRSIDAAVNQKTGLPLQYGKTWTKLLPSLSAHWQPVDHWTAYAQWAKGFLAPNLNTFYTKDPRASDVKPQGTTNIQLGTTWSDDRLNLSADVYDIRFTNKIESRKVGGISYFYNAGGATYKGLELEGSYLLGAGFSMYANGSLNRAIDNGTHQWLPNAPHKTAALGLIYRDGPLYASLIDKFVGQRYGESGETQRLGGYAVTNLAASYTFAMSGSDLRDIRVGVQVGNLFDNQHIYDLAGYTAEDNTPLYFTIPERNYQLTLSARF
jgi:iron complex outermembrane receptor protein